MCLLRSRYAVFQGNRIVKDLKILKNVKIFDKHNLYMYMRKGVLKYIINIITNI